MPSDKQQALAAYINEKWANSNCRLCNQNKWSTEGYINLSISPNAGLVLGGPALPTVAVICMNCGNTVFINALVAGIGPPAPTKAPSGPTGPIGGSGG